MTCWGLVFSLTSEAAWLLITVEIVAVVVMNLIAFGAKSLIWHIFLFLIAGSVVAGVFLHLAMTIGVGRNVVAAVAVSVVSCIFCILLERKSRIRWKEEHMKAKTVLEFGDRKLFATALMDTGNKLYDPFFHKPVILVDEKMMKDMMAYCKTECPERLHFIPFHSVGREQGLLEGITFDCVSIQWDNQSLKFKEVIAASTKESLYKGKEYQVIFHCGLLQES